MCFDTKFFTDEVCDGDKLLMSPALSFKPGSHLCDKHNTSDVSISISTRKKEHVPFFLCLCLCLCRLCYAQSHECEPGFSFRVPQRAQKPIINAKTNG